MSEEVVLVDSSGKPIGRADKLSTHHSNTPLHLAFSCYLFNNKGQLLLTKRAKSKKVWPGVWTNSVCGHPAPEEEIIDAITRRLECELGMNAKDFTLVLPDYRYKTPPYNGIIEHEVCPVYFAQTTDEPKPNPKEVDEYRWLTWEEFRQASSVDKQDEFSWWCKDQLKELHGNKKANELIAQLTNQ